MTTQIKLDFDNITEDVLVDIFRNRKFVWAYFKLTPKYVIVMRTEHGFHVYIEVEEDLDDLDLAFIQLALGDDFKRACFNWTRARLGIPNWNVLFTNSEKEFLPNLSKKVFEVIVKRGEKADVGSEKAGAE